jgi:hypothetical protein
MILSATDFEGKMEHPVLYESKNKGQPVQRRSLLNWVSSCTTGGSSTIRNAAKQTSPLASPAMQSRRPDRVLFEILRQKLSCNEFPALALQSVFSYFSTVLQPAFNNPFQKPIKNDVLSAKWKCSHLKSTLKML